MIKTTQVHNHTQHTVLKRHFDWFSRFAQLTYGSMPNLRPVWTVPVPLKMALPRGGSASHLIHTESVTQTASRSV